MEKVTRAKCRSILGLWTWEFTQKSRHTLDASLPSAASRMCHLPVSQKVCRSVFHLLWNRGSRTGQRRKKEKRNGNGLRYSLSCEPNPQRWLSKARKGAACCSCPPPDPTPPPHASLVLFWRARRVERARAGLNISTVRKVLVVACCCFSQLELTANNGGQCYNPDPASAHCSPACSAMTSRRFTIYEAVHPEWMLYWMQTDIWCIGCTW